MFCWGRGQLFATAARDRSLLAYPRWRSVRKVSHCCRSFYVHFSVSAGFMSCWSIAARLLRNNCSICARMCTEWHLYRLAYERILHNGLVRAFISSFFSVLIFILEYFSHTHVVPLLSCTKRAAATRHANRWKRSPNYCSPLQPYKIQWT